jgi:hypothetical protein
MAAETFIASVPSTRTHGAVGQDSHRLCVATQKRFFETGRRASSMMGDIDGQQNSTAGDLDAQRRAFWMARNIDGQ